MPYSNGSSWKGEIATKNKSIFSVSDLYPLVKVETNQNIKWATLYLYNEPKIDIHRTNKKETPC